MSAPNHVYVFPAKQGLPIAFPSQPNKTLPRLTNEYFITLHKIKRFSPETLTVSFCSWTTRSWVYHPSDKGRKWKQVSLSWTRALQEQVKEADTEDTLVMPKKPKGKLTRISSANSAGAREAWHLCAESRSIYDSPDSHREDVGKKLGTSGFSWAWVL